MSTVYKTSHRYLAAYLVSHGFLIVAWTCEGDYVTFEFSISAPEQLKYVQGFYGNTIAVLPQDFIRGLDTVRLIIRGVRDQGTGIEQKEGLDVQRGAGGIAV